MTKRANDLFAFVEEVVKDLLDNEVLYPQASYFVAKKTHIDDLQRKKQLAY